MVTIEEDGVTEFLSLKKFGNVVYPEFYNRFIQIKSFSRLVKYGGRYINSGTRPIDRSVTDDGIFFDDSRVQYFPIRLKEKGAMNKVVVKKNYSDSKYFTRIFFHENYLVKEKTIEFKVPDWLLVDFKPMNFDGSKIEKNITAKGGFTSYRFTMKDIPAVKSERKSIGVAFTEPHIIIQVKSFEK